MSTDDNEDGTNAAAAQNAVPTDIQLVSFPSENEIKCIQPVLASEPMKWSTVFSGRPGNPGSESTNRIVTADAIEKAKLKYPRTNIQESSSANISRALLHHDVVLVPPSTDSNRFLKVMLAIADWQWAHEGTPRDATTPTPTAHSTRDCKKILILCSSTAAVDAVYREMLCFAEWKTMFCYDPIGGVLMSREHAETAPVQMGEFRTNTHIDVVVTTTANSHVMIERGIFGLIMIEATTCSNLHAEGSVLSYASHAIHDNRCGRLIVLMGTRNFSAEQYEEHAKCASDKIKVASQMSEGGYGPAVQVWTPTAECKFGEGEYEISIIDYSNINFEQSALHKFDKFKREYKRALITETVVEEMVKFVIRRIGFDDLRRDTDYFPQPIAQVPDIIVIAASKEHAAELENRLRVSDAIKYVPRSARMGENGLFVDEWRKQHVITHDVIRHAVYLVLTEGSFWCDDQTTKIQGEPSLYFPTANVEDEEGQKTGRHETEKDRHWTRGRIIIGTREFILGLVDINAFVVVDSCMSVSRGQSRFGIVAPRVTVPPLLGKSKFDRGIYVMCTSHYNVMEILQRSGALYHEADSAAINDVKNVCHYLADVHLNSKCERSNVSRGAVAEHSVKLKKEAEVKGLCTSVNGRVILTTLGHFCHIAFPSVPPDTVCFLLSCGRFGLLLPGLVAAASECVEWRVLTSISAAAHDEIRNRQRYSTLDIYRIYTGRMSNCVSDTVAACNMTTELLVVSNWIGEERNSEEFQGALMQNQGQPTTEHGKQLFWNGVRGLLELEESITSTRHADWYSTNASTKNTCELADKYIKEDGRFECEVVLGSLRRTLEAMRLIPQQMPGAIHYPIFEETLNMYTEGYEGGFTMTTDGEDLFRALQTMSSSNFAEWNASKGLFEASFPKNDANVPSTHIVRSQSRNLPDHSKLVLGWARVAPSSNLVSEDNEDEFYTMLDLLSQMQMARFANIFGSWRTDYDQAKQMHRLIIDLNASGQHMRAHAFLFHNDEEFKHATDFRQKMRGKLHEIIKNSSAVPPKMLKCDEETAKTIIHEWRNAA